MQRIYQTHLSPDQYYHTQAHREVICESVCPRCGQADGLHSHGAYARWITDWLGKLWRILIARFLCPGCRRTVSYLPHFALSYRPIQSPTVEAFFEGARDRRDVQTWLSVLRHYPQRVEAFAPEVIRTVGAGWHGPPPPPTLLWPWIKKACGSLATATRQLVSEFKLTLFHRYQCHQPPPR